MTRRSIALLALLAGSFAAPALHAEAKPEPAAFTADLLNMMLLGDIAEQRSQPALAAQLWFEVARRSRDAQALRRATELSMNSGLYTQALDSAGQWNQQEPDSAEALQVYIGLLVRGNRTDELPAALQRLQKQSPQDLARFFMQLHLLWDKSVDRAQLAPRVVQLAAPFAGMPEAGFAVAVAYANAGQLEQARQELRSVLQRKADWEPALLYLAQLLADEAPQQAEKLLLDSKGLRDSAPQQLTLARILVDRNEIERAHQHFVLASKLQPENLEAVLGAGLSGLQLRKLDVAREYLNRALVLRPADPLPLYEYLGQIAEEQQDWGEAVQWYQRLQNSPAWSRVQWRLPRLLLKAGDGVAAQQSWQAMPQETEAEQVSKALVGAQIWRGLGKPRQAQLVVDAALLKAPDEADLLYDRSISFDEQGLLAEAEKDLRRYLELTSDSATGLNGLGYLLVNRTDRLQEGEALLQRAIALDPDNPAIIDSMGWLYFRQGKYVEAIKWLERAWAAFKDVEVALHLAEAYSARGDRSRAQQFLQEALRLDPTHREVALMRKRTGL